MKRGWLLIFVVWGGVVAAAEPLRARWGGDSGGVVHVLGLDASGRVRLVPEDHPEGEALVPLGEARALRFLLPEDYRRGRRLADDGRSGEAVLVLRRWVPALVPYAGVPESNAGPAVRLYLRLLVQERAWSDALAVWFALDPELAGRDYAAESAALAHGLRVNARREELRLVLDRWWVAPPAPAETGSRRTAANLAADLRRAGLWAEAAVLVGKLRRGTSGAEQEQWDRLRTYLEWHRGSDHGVEAVLRAEAMPPANSEAGALHRLLLGRRARQAGDLRRALDTLAEGLVGAGSTSEWRAEMLAVLAAAYRESGDEATAARIAAHLRRQHPESRWLAEAEARTL